MTDFIPRDHYHALVRTLGSGPALRAILGDQDEVLVIETSEDGPPRTVHVLERCNDGQIRERPPGLPWPMLPPDSRTEPTFWQDARDILKQRWYWKAQLTVTLPLVIFDFVVMWIVT